MTTRSTWSLQETSLMALNTAPCLSHYNMMTVVFVMVVLWWCLHWFICAVLCWHLVVTWGSAGRCSRPVSAHAPSQWWEVHLLCWGTCTLLDYFHLLLLFTSTPLHLRDKYCTFYSTTYFENFEWLVSLWILIIVAKYTLTTSILHFNHFKIAV